MFSEVIATRELPIVATHERQLKPCIEVTTTTKEKTSSVVTTGVDPILIAGPSFRRGASSLERAGADPDA